MKQTLFLESPHQVDMKNVVKSSKHFFGYFNTLETHSETVTINLSIERQPILRKQTNSVTQLDFIPKKGGLLISTKKNSLIEISIVLKKFQKNSVSERPQMMSDRRVGMESKNVPK